MKLPSRLKKLGYSFIANTQISSLTIPAGLTYCATGGSSSDTMFGPLGDANTLKELILEPGMECIPDNLALVKSCLLYTSCQQLFMIALLDDVSVLHDQDQICIFDGGKSVGNDKTCSALHQIIHGFLDLNLGSGIYGRSCLIQDQDCLLYTSSFLTDATRL